MTIETFIPRLDRSISKDDLRAYLSSLADDRDEAEHERAWLEFDGMKQRVLGLLNCRCELGVG